MARKDELTPAVKKAETLLALVTGKQFAAVDNLSDEQFDRMFRLGAKALYLQAVAKSQQAMASISEDDLANSSGSQKAIIAGIMADKAEKLAQLVGIREEEGGSVTVEDFKELVASIQERVTNIRALGVELTVENPMNRPVDTGFGAQGGVISADHTVLPND